MPRLIDAYALIAKWEEEAKHITEFAHPGMVYGIINDVKRQPTIEVPKWIPCSERLPEYGIDVLTVDRYGEYELNHIIDEEDGEWYWEKPIAWMPLPEPYKGGADMRQDDPSHPFADSVMMRGGDDGETD